MPISPIGLSLDAALRAVALVILAGCGEPVAASSTDASSDAETQDASGDACPSDTPSEGVGVGSACAFAGTCTITMSTPACGSVLVPIVCTGGHVALAPDGSTDWCPTPPPSLDGGYCGADVSVGDLCQGHLFCTIDYCGPGDWTTCSCSGGAWTCADVPCGGPGPCVLGGTCAPMGARCVNVGTGPCGADERLLCGPPTMSNGYGTYQADGFPCDAPVSCTMQSADGGSMCTCQGGLLTCAGQ